MKLTQDPQPATLAPPTSTPKSPVPPPDDPRVVRALEEYSAALKAGQKPDRREFLACYPEIGAELAECLEGLDFVQAAAALLQPPAGGHPAGAPIVAAEVCPEGPLGDYRILREVGRGGMGVVYEAVQISLGRQVALKVLPFAAALDAKQLQRFKNEAQAAAHLHHQNIVPVYGVGCERGVHYYAMQFIDGQTLAAMIAELRLLAGLDKEDRVASTAAASALAGELASGRWAPPQQGRDNSQLTGPYTPMPSSPEAVAAGSPSTPAPANMATQPSAGVLTERSTRSAAFFRTVANLGVQAAGALEYAHGVGVTHRDIKPANLLMDLRGNLWITDFGLSHFQSQAGLTMTGDLVGTLRYMSPEQALAQRVVIDHRTDVYSLGATLYELLTLEPVFNGRDRQELLRQIAFEEPKSPRRLNKAIPAEMETIVLKALEKNPTDRYSTAQELADDLGRFLRDESIRAKRPSLVQRARKWGRRHQEVVRTALVALAFLVVTFAVGASLAVWRLNDEQKATRDQLRLTEQAQEQAMHRLYDARLAQAKAGSSSRRVGQRFDSLDAVAEARKIARDLNLPEERLLPLRNAAIACLALPDLRVGKKWYRWPTDTLGVSFDSTMKHYARVDRQGVIHIHRVAGDAEICSFAGMGAGESEAWFSPDGQFVAQMRLDRRFKVWKLASLEPVVLDGDMSARGGAAFSPDSMRLAVGHADGSICLYELPSGRQLKQLEGVPGYGFMAFHPEGRQLAVSRPTGIQVYDLATGKKLGDLPQPTGPERLAWHPDGKTLAAACNDSKIYLWDVAEGKQTHVLEGSWNRGIQVGFNHAGDLLASGGWEGILRLWDPRTGQQLFSMPAWTGARFSLDDRLLATDIRDGNLGLWEVATSGAYRTLVRAAVAAKRTYHRPAISSDGRLVAVGMLHGVGLWDLASGKELPFLKSPGTHFVLFEASGALLTNGSAGLLRWPVQADAASPELLRIGPPHKLSVPGPIHDIACSRDGKVIAVSQFQGGRVLHADRPDQPVRLGPHEDARYVAVSPDGVWVATGSHNETGVKIWDAQTGECKKELPVDGSRVGFSPDGKWLATTGDGLRLWAVGSWQEGPQIGGGGAAFAFSPNGKLLAVDTGNGAVRLVDPHTGREYARLEEPSQDRALLMGMSFSPDGTQLVATNGDGQSIHVWDLRMIRTQLAKMDLDWDLPPYPPPSPDNGKPLQVKIDLGPLHQAHEYQQRALGLALCPDPTFRDPKRAVELGTKAVELAPQDGNCWFTLGVAQYRSGNWKAALESLEKGMPLRKSGDCGDWFFLAMVHWKLGDKAQACYWYDKADLWMATHHHPAWPPLRAEAAALMGIKEKKDQ